VAAAAVPAPMPVAPGSLGFWSPGPDEEDGS